ncbi:MAG: hypothetical protein EZS28_049212 [Streblomastix strix]|uniref:Uncharacterized protein n=1 Tax=Streblomastix strix TaxID=222440 RepID=A0A5J4TC61_9EUKA|nr:MAG: hypothetical protein EZS28_049212 [Streblomastix strix]
MLATNTLMQLMNKKFLDRLQSSKDTAQQIASKLARVQEQQVLQNINRSKFTLPAQRLASMFLCSAGMKQLNPMYRITLDRFMKCVDNVLTPPSEEELKKLGVVQKRGNAKDKQQQQQQQAGSIQTIQKNQDQDGQSNTKQLNKVGSTQNLVEQQQAQQQQEEVEQYVDDEEKTEYALKLQYQQDSYKYYLERENSQLSSTTSTQFSQNQNNQSSNQIEIKNSNIKENDSDEMNEEQMLEIALLLSQQESKVEKHEQENEQTKEEEEDQEDIQKINS